ncbi:D-xylose ABC transporter substrate-binding protein [Mesobacillus stamsii]|uniref:D-xylose transport system substrate-binding protein n=1 Tax=Mesobacillus stamsii TaxID=225347 RepID=A0ABU0G0A1_9BACI|nr:D-xylose ABC transporter substrate-binding protein [Mesobacillus stamsii]MDQ0415574.1 D-xylose transport system substrate-binding protein [Mesobacillus stamsii]
MATTLRKVGLLILLFLLMILTACEEEVPPKNEKKEPENERVADSGDKLKIGFSMDTLEEERWPRDRDFFKEAVESLGADVMIREARGDDSLQIVHAETLISAGVDVLVIVPHNAEAVATIVNKAHNAGIKVISYDRLVKNSSVDLYISFDNELVGELQAKAITKLVPKGKYVYIGGANTDNNAHLLKQGVFNVLQPLIDKGDIQIVYDQWSENWTPENAYANMQAALKTNNNEIDAVIAGNDGTASGVIKALEAQGLAKKIPVAGQDAELAAAQRIVQGTQAVTIYKPIKTLAYEAAKAAIKMAEGETVKTNRKMNNGKLEIPSLLLTPIAVDKNNIDDTIIADGFHQRDQVYEKPAE